VAQADSSVMTRSQLCAYPNVSVTKILTQSDAAVCWRSFCGAIPPTHPARWPCRYSRWPAGAV